MFKRIAIGLLILTTNGFSLSDGGGLPNDPHELARAWGITPERADEILTQRAIEESKQPVKRRQADDDDDEDLRRGLEASLRDAPQTGGASSATAASAAAGLPAAGHHFGHGGSAGTTSHAPAVAPPAHAGLLEDVELFEHTNTTAIDYHRAYKAGSHQRVDKFYVKNQTIINILASRSPALIIGRGNTQGVDKTNAYDRSLQASDWFFLDPMAEVQDPSRSDFILSIWPTPLHELLGHTTGKLKYVVFDSGVIQYIGGNSSNLGEEKHQRVKKLFMEKEGAIPDKYIYHVAEIKYPAEYALIKEEYDVPMQNLAARQIAIQEQGLRDAFALLQEGGQLIFPAQDFKVIPGLTSDAHHDLEGIAKPMKARIAKILGVDPSKIEYKEVATTKSDRLNPVIPAEREPVSGPGSTSGRYWFFVTK